MAAPLALSHRIEASGLDGDINVIVTLRNCGPRSVSVIFDNRLQPPEPELRNAAGKVIRHQDHRAVAKFDRTPYTGLFVTLAPGAEVTQQGFFGRLDDAWEGAIGPFAFAELAPGTYQISISWASRLSRGVDEGTGQVKTFHDAWTGRLVSPPTTLVLPAR
jgi:hypothetical protein